MIIRRETLQAALAATTSDNTRYFLHAVQAEASANRVVATNGHILLIATDKSPMKDEDFPNVAGAEFHGSPEGAVLLDADVCKSLIATMPKKTSIPILQTAQLSVNGSPTTLTLAATDLKAPRVAAIDTKDAGLFPAYDRIMPKADRAGVKLCMAVDVLEQLIKAAKAVSSKHITFDVPTSDADVKSGAVISAAGVTMDGADVLVTGVAMPCRL
jgi:DNA polymerase III sliding clamp (beta) subunit (PCNA family)